MPEVSVVIVTWNSSADIERCLRSLAQHPPTAPWEVVVVDNDSHDDTVARATRAIEGVRVIANATNRGLAAANNQGIVAADGEAVVVSNPDVEFTAGALDALRAALARHPRAAFVVPRLVHTDGSLQTSAGSLPTLAEALRGRRASHRRGETSGFWWDGWRHDEERRIGHGGEACYAVRRDAIAAIGPQDERYRLDWEGIEWAARAADAGWEVWFCPDATIVHHGGTSIRQVPFRWIVSSHLGMYRYFAATRPAPLRPVLAVAIAARAAAKLGAQLVGSRLYDRAHRGR